MSYQPPQKLEEKLSQLFLVGTDTAQLEELADTFAHVGLGGILLFRHHFNRFSTAQDVQAFLSTTRNVFKGSGLRWFAIDQEGGQVERLPHWICPTGINPVVFGMRQNLFFVERVNREVAQRMRWLGIDVNFSPTVDLNLERSNPIIGVRSYGQSSESIVAYAKAVLKPHWDVGILPVLKHFPGHGSGTVDSHLALPVFEQWHPQELVVYEQLFQRPGSWAVLVAHGIYPELYRIYEERQLAQPASLSYAITTRLLKDKLGFQGVVFSDDLMMAAIDQGQDPTEVAYNALMAGVDCLVYRRALPEAYQAYEGLLSMLKRGRLSEAIIDQKLEKLYQLSHYLHQRHQYYDYPPTSLSPEACHAQSVQWAQEALIEIKHQMVSPLPLTHRTRWALVSPDVSTIVHYKDDAQVGLDLSGWLKSYSLFPYEESRYPVGQPWIESMPLWPEQSLDVIVFIAFNSVIHHAQAQYYKKLQQQHPNAKLILVSIGMPTDGEECPDPWIHLQLPSYRPASMQVLAQWLTTKPQAFVSKALGSDQVAEDL